MKRKKKKKKKKKMVMAECLPSVISVNNGIQNPLHVHIIASGIPNTHAKTRHSTMNIRLVAIAVE